jgi:glycosyltransferase involved in cell wall biosynthesis
LRALVPDLTVDVVTSLPNRYKDFAAEAHANELETDGSLTVYRLPMPAHRSDMSTQAKSYAQFAWRVVRLVSRRHYDLVFATSSRLMTASLGAFVARRLGAPVYLDIRDLFADTMANILPPQGARVVVPVASALESWTFRRAVHINLVSKGFDEYVRKRHPRASLSFVPNGIDEEFVLSAPQTSDRRADGLATVVYAGNIGQGQGLDVIMPGLAKALEGRARFKLIGDGGRREQLLNALRAAGVTNVDVVPPVPRARLIEEYLSADVLFVHLNAHEAFKRVLPSKIFEYAAMGKPILAGVAGYAAEFIGTEVSNAAVFPPCDVSAGRAAWDLLDFGVTDRSAFVLKYARHTVTSALARDIASHLPDSTERLSR